MQKFLILLHTYYVQNKRESLPWRKTKDTYHILLSEIMLQQTQVSRVLVKYDEFLKRFPTVQSLASAPLRDVLTLWQGLGYNRRAKFLHEASKILNTATKKDLADYTFLKSLPGVGQSTAGAVLVFTQNKPIVFIETNIRAVLMHHFFKDSEKVSDKEIATVLEKLLNNLGDKFTPREFYYALYDYGTHLKNTLGKEKKALHTKSKHYVKQSTFTGSRRQLRAFILKTFLEMKDSKKLAQKVKNTLPTPLHKYTPQDIEGLIRDLKNEGFFE
ncbi:MAG: A/G-specific adenine glycosylase [Patescibacteria group bacterium]